jgi:putative inorganic carbon (HCO3(-)) transporter
VCHICHVGQILTLTQKLPPRAERQASRPREFYGIFAPWGRIQDGQRVRWGWGLGVRSIIFTVAIFAMLPLALVFPYVGLLLWAWTSFSSIYRETFGFASDFTFNFYIAITTLIAWLISSEPKTLPNQPMPFIVMAFALWMSISTYFALDFNTAYPLWENHIKTLLLVLVLMAMATTKLRIQAFVWIIVISIGYYAAKGAGFMLMTGSIGSRVFGPEDSMIADNNNLSLAIVITIPLLNYLRASSKNAWVKGTCVVLLAFSIIATIGTYSRGGVVGLVVVGAALLISSRKKALPLLAALVVVAGIWNFAPGDWFDRVQTIQSYRADSSSVGRLNAWQTSWNLAQDRPLLGGGLSSIEQKRVYRRYRGPGDTTEGRAAHSIYFQVLGDQGFVGLGLYLLILITGVYNLLTVQRWTAGREDLDWANMLARMMLVSFVGFVAAGALLSMAYYDVFLCMMGLTVALREVVRSAADPAAEDTPIEESAQLQPAWRTAAVRDGQPR